MATEPTIGLVCCSAIAEDAVRASREAGLGEPLLSTFDPVCHLPLQAPLSEEALQAPLAEADVTLGLCLRCQRRGVGEGIWRGVDARVPAASASELLLGRARAQAAIDDGAFLVLGGWLRDWRRIVIDDWGMDRTTATDFFGDCNKRLLYVSTYPADADPHLDEAAAMAEYVGLPWSVERPGTDHLALRLRAAVKAAQGTAELERARNELDAARGVAADHAVTLELLHTLGTLVDAPRIRQTLVEAASMLFAPTRAWLDAPQPPTREADAGTEVDETRSASATSEVVRVDSAGFDIALQLQGRSLGTLHVRDVAFPHHLERYLPMAELLGHSGAIALHAAYAFERERELKDALELKVSELDQVVHTISHDLKEPLRAIQGFASFLDEDYGALLDDEGRRLIGTILQASGQMRAQMDDLLTLARVGRAHTKRVRFELGDLVAEVLSRLSFAIGERSVEVEVGPLPAVMASRRWVGEVVQNLLSNAIRYNDSPTPRIEIAARAAGPEDTGRVVIAVSDNGPGIDPRHHDRIFQLFRRLGRRDSAEGTGAGLAITQRIIHQEGGRIWVESTRGGGATFCFSLPSATGDPEERSEHDTGANSAGRRQPDGQ